MNNKTSFENIVSEIRCLGAPLWLFGCGELGRYAQHVFLHMGIDIAGYISNHAVEDGRLFEGKRVLLPQEAVRESADGYVALCIFTDQTARQVEDELRGMGYHKFISADAIIEAYLSLNLKPIGFRMDRGGIVVDRFTLDITEVCSLRCKYCGAFVPYVKGKHYPMEECIKSVKRLASIVNEIERITVQGGEPFLHPQFAEICHEICKINNVKKVNIATNGTIVPAERFFTILLPFKDKIEILVSDYGKLNRQLDTLRKTCLKRGIRVSLNELERGWQKPTIPEKQNQSEKENRNKYVTCTACSICPMVWRGRLYKCATAAMGEMLGITPHNEQDSVDFLDETVSDDELKERLIKYMTTTKAPLACDYCKAGIPSNIPIAEQLDEEWDLQQLKATY